MTRDDHSDVEAARDATDRLALALEDVGFDVGQQFPGLHDAINRHGVAVVQLGDVGPAVALQLCEVLACWRITDHQQSKEDGGR